jgi:hypothetical protein
LPRKAVRKVLRFVAVASLCLAACGPGGAHNPISQNQATTSALAAITQLEQFHAKSVPTAPITRFTVVSARVTTETASVPDGQGNVLTVSSAPSKAWVVIITAPPQGIWGSISAVAEVDSTSGVVAGSGLWAVPADRPVKTGS